MEAKWMPGFLIGCLIGALVGLLMVKVFGRPDGAQGVSGQAGSSQTEALKKRFVQSDDLVDSSAWRMYHVSDTLNNKEYLLVMRDGVAVIDVTPKAETETKDPLAQKISR